jgi:hypothetical protein
MGLPRPCFIPAGCRLRTHPTQSAQVIPDLRMPAARCQPDPSRARHCSDNHHTLVNEPQPLSVLPLRCLPATRYLLPAACSSLLSPRLRCAALVRGTIPRSKLCGFDTQGLLEELLPLRPACASLLAPRLRCAGLAPQRLQQVSHLDASHCSLAALVAHLATSTVHGLQYSGAQAAAAVRLVAQAGGRRMSGQGHRQQRWSGWGHRQNAHGRAA